jgi:peptide/nickel transport system permease protein
VAGYVVKRLILLLVTWLLLSAVVFGLTALIPGDPASAILGPYATEERVAQLQREMGMSGAWASRYLRGLGRVLHGDLGHAYSVDLPVSRVVWRRLGPTLLLATTALTFAIPAGLSLGMVSARRARTPAGMALSALSLVGISTPTFVLALVIMLLLAAWAGMYPVSGMQDALGSGWLVRDVASHLVLPALSLGLVSASVIARLTRRYALDAAADDYVRVARAKGLSESAVYYRHIFRTAFARVIPVIGLQAGFVLGGAVYVESVFQWPGLGRLLVDAVEKRDLMLMQGAVLVLATAYVLTSLVADLVQRAIDPRVDA